MLIEKGADINTQSRNTAGWTPLMIAVAEGHSMTATILLKARAKVNATNQLGRTALMFAASYGNSEIVTMLLKQGADPDIVPNDAEGKTALMAAAKEGYQEIVGILLKSGADPNIKNKEGKTALSYSNADIARLLRQAGAKD
jgi:serine/threonine-protein phosphatase 6 regulatory ankyrin repeat subunit B